jgi:hypothetical protein
MLEVSPGAGTTCGSPSGRGWGDLGGGASRQQERERSGGDWKGLEVGHASLGIPADALRDPGSGAGDAAQFEMHDAWVGE